MPNLTKEQLESMTQDDLDEMVHDLKGEEAARINNDGKCAQIDYIMGASPVLVIVVEGGLVRNVLTSQEVPLQLFVLDHDVQEVTGHKLDGKDVNFYEEEAQIDYAEVQRIVVDGGSDRRKAKK